MHLPSSSKNNDTSKMTVKYGVFVGLKWQAFDNGRQLQVAEGVAGNASWLK